MTLAKCIAEGMKFLRAGAYDQSLEIFRTRDPEEHWFLSYGTATALFKKHTSQDSMDLGNIEEVLGLYNIAINQEPNMADTYLMAGLAYMKKVSLQSAARHSRHQLLDSLHQAESNLIKAAELNSHYEVEEDLKVIKKRREELEGAFN